MKVLNTALAVSFLVGGVISPVYATQTSNEHVIVATTATDGTGVGVGDTLPEGTVDLNGKPNPTIELGNNAALVSAMTLEIEKTTGVPLLTFDSTNNLLQFDIVTYNKLEANDKRKYMKTVLPYIKESQLDPMVKNKMFEFVKNQDSANTKVIAELEGSTTANVAVAGGFINRIFGPGISTVFGVIAYLVFLFLAVGTVLDLVYIALPIFRGMLQKRIEKVEAKGKSARFTLFLVSPEAMYAARREEENPDEDPAIWVYFKRRFVVMLAIGIIMLYFIQGEIVQVMIWIVEAFRPLLEEFTLNG